MCEFESDLQQYLNGNTAAVVTKKNPKLGTHLGFGEFIPQFRLLRLSGQGVSWGRLVAAQPGLCVQDLVRRDANSIRDVAFRARSRWRRLSQQIRQFRKVRSDPSRLIAREQLSEGFRNPLVLIEINVGWRGPALP